MSAARVSFPPGLTTKPLGADLWSPGAGSHIAGLHSVKPADPHALPIPARAGTSPSPEIISKCQQLTSMILASSDPLEHARLVNELAALSLSLSAQLTASRNAINMEAVRSANAQAINDELRKNLAATEEALATTANMLAVQAANAASAHASLGDERAIATAVIRELVIKEDALQTATAMLNAQYSNLESARASLHEKDQEILQKNQEIYSKNMEIQQEKQRTGEAINANFTKHRKKLSKQIVGASRDRLPDGSDGEGSGSSVGQGSRAIKAQNAGLKKALAEKVDLLIVEEHRTASLRNLLNQSIIEVGRLKTCLEEATDPARHPLPEDTHPTAAGSESQSLKVQIAELKEALAEKTNLLKVEEHNSACLRKILHESITEVGHPKPYMAGDAYTPPLSETPQHYQYTPETPQYKQDTPDTPARQEGYRHEKPRQANNSLRGDQKKGSGGQDAKCMEDGEAEGVTAPTTTQFHNEEHLVDDTDEVESLTDEENGSALSTATTQGHNEEPFILHTGERALSMEEEPGRAPTTANIKVGNERHSITHADEDNSTISPLGIDM